MRDWGMGWEVSAMSPLNIAYRNSKKAIKQNNFECYLYLFFSYLKYKLLINGLKENKMSVRRKIKASKECLWIKGGDYVWLNCGLLASEPLSYIWWISQHKDLSEKQSHFHYSSQDSQILALPASLAIMAQPMAMHNETHPPGALTQEPVALRRGSLHSGNPGGSSSCQASRPSSAKQQHPRPTAAVAMQGPMSSVQQGQPWWLTRLTLWCDSESNSGSSLSPPIF